MTKYMKKLRNNPLLSIVIVSFNTREVLRDCLVSLDEVKSELDFETIVSDNGSSDGSVQMVKKDFPGVKLIENKANLGFSKGNNVAQKICKGKFVLFLNSDTIVLKGALGKTIDFISKNTKIGSMTCKIVLKDGKLDKDTRRSFPTPLVALTHFSGMDRMFPKSKFFAKYWYSYIDENSVHEVDVIQGAFHLTRKNVLDKVGWFDEDYFLDGEDIDLCWKIKHLGYKIVYYPKVSIIHLKKASKKKHKNKSTLISGIKAMEIFYRKHLWQRYPFYLNYTVLLGIKILLVVRLVKFYTFSK